MSNIRSILLRHIRQDGGTQARAKMDPAAVEEYAEAMEAGAKFPPVVVFEDHISNLLWLGDGFHRVAAAVKLGHKNVRADIRPGGLREARLFAIGANVTHGVRRSNADKRLAVQLLLDDSEWGAWGNREIARVAGVSEFLVREMKEEGVRLNRSQAPEKVEGPSTPAGEKPADPPAPKPRIQERSVGEIAAEMQAGATESVCGCEDVPHRGPSEQDRVDWNGTPRPAPPAAPALKPLPEELGLWANWSDEDRGDEFTRRLAALCNGTSEEEDCDYGPWDLAWDTNPKDAFTRLLVAEAREPMTFTLPTDEERDAWLAAHTPAPVAAPNPAPAKVTPLAQGPGNAALDLTINLIKTAFKIPEDEAIVPFLQELIGGKDKQIAEQESRIKDLERKLAEAGDQIQELHEDLGAAKNALDADDLLDRFEKEVAAVGARARQAESRLRGAQALARDGQHMAKMWKKKFEDTQKPKKGKSAPEPDPELDGVAS